jgi:hypothetical protein
LDRVHASEQVRRWFQTTDGDLAWQSAERKGEGDELSHLGEHIRHLYTWLERTEELGRPPEDLAEVLAKVALASPAVTCLRALMRHGTPDEAIVASETLLGRAARAADGFRTLFNQAETINLVRSLRESEEQRYWESVLDYCVSGNLQAVVDEYAHLLLDTPALMGLGLAQKAKAFASELQTVLSLRTANLEFDELQSDGARVVREKRSLRCRFALRFGDGKNEENSDEFRTEFVRKTFNSPFRPFILASTSIGQEGLDFHRYCHEIYHWNLPANPVDLEQREGRINRYKGHVIRRNVARRSGLSGLVRGMEPWERLFAWAREDRKPGQNDLVPFWVYEVPDGVKVVRHVPALPLSRELVKIEDLRRTLAAYRLVFGQPRQEDLVKYLRGRCRTDEELQALLAERIDLSPLSFA